MIFHNISLEGAIFDMDGTLFDTERLRIEMLKQASKEIFGEAISDQILYDSLGVSAVTAEKLAKQRYGGNYPYKQIRARADELERQHIREKGVPVKEGIYNLLERLKKNGLLLALATSTRREIAEEYLINARVLRFFDIIVCGDEVEKGKPDPEIFLKAASELNCESVKCLVFEDSQNGLLAASAAGGLPIFIKDLKEPDPEVKALAFRSYAKLTDFLEELIQQMPKMPLPSLNEHFPQSIGYMVAGIHGFGAMGGGYLAQVFSHWDGYTRPKQIIGVTSNNHIRRIVNTLGKYQVGYERLAFFQTIANIKLIDMVDEPQVIQMYSRVQIVGLSLPEQAIRTQAPIIAKGLLQRYERTRKSLTILIVMNKINAADYVKKHIKNALIQLAGEEKAQRVLENTFFSGTVVNRMVSRLPEDVVLSRLQINLSSMHKTISDFSGKFRKFTEAFEAYTAKDIQYRGSQVDEIQTLDKAITVVNNILCMSQFANDLSRINITLFSSEPDMPLYAEKGSPLLDHLRQVVTVEDITSMQAIKNKLSNGTHAIIGWYSALLGYKTIGQGMGDRRVLKLAENILTNEIRPSMLKENPDSKQYINSITMDFLIRCRASFKDDCIRVGRDPLRKLQSGERIMGAIQLGQKHGLSTGGLEFGAACAILYSIQSIDPKDKECQIIKQLYEKNYSVIDVLAYDGKYNKKKYVGLRIVEDAALMTRIQDAFNNLAKELSASTELVSAQIDA
ncbi:HAD-IA family hydrolase [Candidatus Bathyarchaeota archaeon]|nr:HAD-IA family hydrolase [Candidatus Bathyarchaeota archaeon]